MTTEVQEGANGTLKKDEVEPLGEIEEVVKKPTDLCNSGEANGAVGKLSKSGCGTLPAAEEKEEPLTKTGPPKDKSGIKNLEDDDDDNEYSSEEEEGDGEGDEDTREGEAEADEDKDEDYTGEEDDDDDDDGDEESEPPSKKRKD